MRPLMIFCLLLYSGEQLPLDARVDPNFPLDAFVEDNCPPPVTSSPVKPPRPSEPWSVLEGESAAADNELMEVDADDNTVKGKGGWKSAENGASELGEFGIPRSISTLPVRTVIPQPCQV